MLSPLKILAVAAIWIYQRFNAKN